MATATLHSAVPTQFHHNTLLPDAKQPKLRSNRFVATHKASSSVPWQLRLGPSKPQTMEMHRNSANANSSKSRSFLSPCMHVAEMKMCVHRYTLTRAAIKQENNLKHATNIYIQRTSLHCCVHPVCDSCGLYVRSNAGRLSQPRMPAVDGVHPKLPAASTS